MPWQFLYHFSIQVLTTQTYHFSYHYESRFCDILRYFTRFSLSTSNAFHHLSIKHFHHFPVLTSHDERLAFVYNLKDIELQIITLRHICRICPENRMIRRLCSEFHLAESLVCCLCRLFDCLCQKFLCHEMGAGTGCKIAAVFYQF